ncbi:MAG TPA: hypothetical protein VI031_05825, partial [Pyrinomonadaceae bacterium]
QRIEVIRERSANYHVFAFVDGTRPSDDLIAASLEEASTQVKQAHHVNNKNAKKSAKHVQVNIKRRKVSNRRRR